MTASGEILVAIDSFAGRARGVGPRWVCGEWDSGLSLRAMAEKADVSYTTTARIEAGRLDPSTGTLRRLLRAIGQDLVLDRAPTEAVP
jgi:DNA-binding XRE family transcriptional regulator